jgi:hypothetical protein
MCERFRVHLSGRHSLQAIVSYGGGCSESAGDVRFID